MFAHGSTFSIGGVVVGEITSISLPDRTRDEIDSTHMGSGGDREYIPGLRDGGSVTIEGRLAAGTAGDVGQDAIEANYNATGDAAIAAMLITLPDNPGGVGDTATRYAFDGFVTEINGDLPYDDHASYSVTIKVTGAVTKTKAVNVP